jgi:hypothetical protein
MELEEMEVPETGGSERWERLSSQENGTNHAPVNSSGVRTCSMLTISRMP